MKELCSYVKAKQSENAIIELKRVLKELVVNHVLTHTQSCGIIIAKVFICESNTNNVR